MPVAKACLHCQQPRNYRNRGLCWTCYHTLAIRALYPLAPARYTRRGLGIDTPEQVKPLTLAPYPTSALPGTIQKIAVMAWRAEHHHHIFHPDDARPKDAGARTLDISFLAVPKNSAHN